MYINLQEYLLNDQNEHISQRSFNMLLIAPN